MIEISLPGWTSLQLAHLVLDVNGTLARDGALLPGVAERIGRLRQDLTVHLLSADTHGRLDEIGEQLGLDGVRLRPDAPEPEQKGAYVRQLGVASVVAIGNGANDVDMLREAALGVVVLGPEGTAVEALLVADVATSSIGDALDLLAYPKRLVATLRR